MAFFGLALAQPLQLVGYTRRFHQIWKDDICKTCRQFWANLRAKSSWSAYANQKSAGAARQS
jgi:hypothetical protein